MGLCMSSITNKSTTPTPTSKRNQTPMAPMMFSTTASPRTDDGFTTMTTDTSGSRMLPLPRPIGAPMQMAIGSGLTEVGTGIQTKTSDGQPTITGVGS